MTAAAALDAAARDELLADVVAAARDVARARADLDSLRRDLDELIAEAQGLGVAQHDLAAALGVTRETIRRATRRHAAAR